MKNKMVLSTPQRLSASKEKKIIILLVLFFVTTLLVYGNTESAPAHRTLPLSIYFQHVKGYETLRRLSLDPANIKMLKVDDYAYYDYKNQDGTVTLYIGYYDNPDKAYDAHSPTVCFPSQGWHIDKQPTTRSLAVGRNVVHYQRMTTSYGDQKELVLYWYQTYARTSTQVYRNKINMALNSLRGKEEQYAFVRVTVPFADSTYEKAEKAGKDFVKVFSQKFIEYFSRT